MYDNTFWRIPLNLHLGARATAVAKSITDTYSQYEKELREIDAWRSVLRFKQDGNFDNIVNNTRMSNAVFMQQIIDSQVELMWRRSRVIYAIDPYMQRELIRSTSAIMPGDIFQRIPHSNPLVVFPEPIDIGPLGDGYLKLGYSSEYRQAVFGFYVFGSTVPSGTPTKRFCYTDDDEMRSLGVMFATAILDRNGNRVTWDQSRLTVPIDVEKFDVNEQIDKLIAIKQRDPLSGGQTSYSESATWAETLLSISLNVLLYLCTDDADLSAAPIRKPKRGKHISGRNDQVRPEKPSRMIRVGWKVGPALREARRRVTENPLPTGTGYKQPPHQRRGHFKMQAHGKGRALRKLIYVQPYLAGKDLLGKEPMVNRVIPVR